ncbi:hypothetical protein EV714DRAFT_211476 [Schizophyllum commune]
MSTETIPHQIDQAAPVSAFLGTENEAHGGMHGGEMSAALQDWIHRAMDALAAVGPPPVGVIPHSVGAVPHLVPNPALPAQDATLDVLPFRIDTSHVPTIPQDRLELIRAAFNYVRVNLAHGGQTTARSDGGRSDSLVDGSDAVLGNLIVDGPECTADAAAGSNTTVAHHPIPSPSPPDDIPHTSRTPTPTANVVLTANALGHPATSCIADKVMADGMQGNPVNGGTMNPLPSAVGTAEHADGTSFSGDHEEDEENAMDARASDTLEESARLTASSTQDVAAYDARALQKQEEQRRRVWEDKKRAWSSKDATPTREDDGTKGHPSRAPKARRQASPPALLNRLRDPTTDACHFSTSQRDVPQSLTPSDRSPRDRSPTPSTPPPSEYAGLPLAQRLSAGSPPLIRHPGPLFGRIGPRVDDSNYASSSQRATDETRGRRTARTSRSTEPSSTLSRNGALPRALPTREAEKAPAAAASAQIATTGSRRVPSTNSRTVPLTGTRKADGAGNSEQPLESASRRPATLASSAPGTTSVKTAEGVTDIPKLVVDEGRASGKAGPSDAMAVDDPAEPTTQSIVPRMATTTVSPQIVTPPPTPPTPSSNVDNRVSLSNPGPLPPPADRASSSTGVHVSIASTHHNPGAGESDIQPQSPHKRSYEEIATELLSSTIPLDRSHSTRAQELAPARSSSFVFSAPPATSTQADPISSSVPEPTGAAPLPLSPLSALSSTATSSSPSGSITSLPIDPAELGEFIFSLPVDESAPVSNSRETTEEAMDVVQGVDWDQSVNTDEQSDGPSKMDEDVDEPMKVDEDTDEAMKVEEEEYMASTKGEEEEPAMKTENEVTSMTEEVKDEVLVPVRPAPRYEPRALVPKLRQHSAVSPSIGPSYSSLGHITNSQSFWIEMPPRTLPQESYLPMSQDGCEPSRAQDEQQPLIPPPEQALRRSTRSTSSVYRRPSAAHFDSPRASASAPAWTPSASAQSASCTQSSRAAVVQPSLAVAQSPFVAGQSSAASIQASSVPARVSSAAAGPSSKPMDLPATSAPISVTSLGRSYRIPAPSDDEEEGTPILKLRRMNDDHLDERPSKRLRWA